MLLRGARVRSWDEEGSDKKERGCGALNWINRPLASRERNASNESLPETHATCDVRGLPSIGRGSIPSLSREFSQEWGENARRIIARPGAGPRWHACEEQTLTTPHWKGKELAKQSTSTEHVQCAATCVVCMYVGHRTVVSGKIVPCGHIDARACHRSNTTLPALQHQDHSSSSSKDKHRHHHPSSFLGTAKLEQHHRS